ncbi:SAM-dependent methyltransferase [Streptomyces sp. NPDC048297]|uniref:SAM-dependent methyltransferase n=1 Tax=Streptomyces sp. NPDC048297 TaxID=3365531 RepID=UPI003719AF38
MGEGMQSSNAEPFTASGVFDCLAAGCDHSAAEQAAAARMVNVYPTVQAGVRESRAFMRRAITYLVREGVDQFLDIGTGIPTKPHINHIAQSLNPRSRIVYAGSRRPTGDQLSRLFASSSSGAVDHVHADIGDTDRLLSSAAATLDFSRPVAVSFLAVLHFLAEADDPAGVVKSVMGRVAAGSYLLLTHGTYDFSPLDEKLITAAYSAIGLSANGRTREAILEIVDDLTLVGPGLCPVTEWSPEGSSVVRRTGSVPMYAALGVKKGTLP